MAIKKPLFKLYDEHQIMLPPILNELVAKGHPIPYLKKSDCILKIIQYPLKIISSFSFLLIP